MAFSISKVHAFLKALPDVSVGTRWGNRTWLVGETGFAWERPLSKADIKRFGEAPLPTGDILGVRTENLDAKDAMLAMGLPGFYKAEAREEALGRIHAS